MQHTIQRAPGVLLALASSVAAFFCLAAPASALNCGSKGQPACVETGPPGVVVTPPPGGNPYNLQPLSTPPGPNTQLWPDVRGHKPYGFNAVSSGRDGTTIDEEAYLNQQFGSSIARMGADWGGIQFYPNTSAGGRPWDYASYSDKEYLALIKAGIRPLFAITRTPRRFTTRWNTYAGTSQPGCGTTDVCWAPPRAEQAAWLRTFATDLARRYPLAAGIEFWNEPNLSNPFWGTDPPNPEYYATLLNLVHDAVKSVRPNMPVIAGGLSSSDRDTTINGHPLMSVRTFVRRMLLAGAQDNADAISFHPYLGKFDTNGVLRYRVTQASQQVVNAYADAGKPMAERVMFTESGASTTNYWTEQRQSDWLSYQYHLVDTSDPELPLSSRTDAMLVHETVENPGHSDPLQRGYGFVKRKNSAGGFTLKKAFCTFRTLWGGYTSCPTAFDPPG